MILAADQWGMDLTISVPISSVETNDGFAMEYQPVVTCNRQERLSEWEIIHPAGKSWFIWYCATGNVYWTGCAIPCMYDLGNFVLKQALTMLWSFKNQTDF